MHKLMTKFRYFVAGFRFYWTHHSLCMSRKSSSWSYQLLQVQCFVLVIQMTVSVDLFCNGLEIVKYWASIWLQCSRRNKSRLRFLLYVEFAIVQVVKSTWDLEGGGDGGVGGLITSRQIIFCVGYSHWLWCACIALYQVQNLPSFFSLLVLFLYSSVCSICPDQIQVAHT